MWNLSNFQPGFLRKLENYFMIEFKIRTRSSLWSNINVYFLFYFQVSYSLLSYNWFIINLIMIIMSMYNSLSLFVRIAYLNHLTRTFWCPKKEFLQADFILLSSAIGFTNDIEKVLDSKESNMKNKPSSNITISAFYAVLRKVSQF